MSTVFQVEGFTWCGLSGFHDISLWLTRYNRPQASGGSDILGTGRFGGNALRLGGGLFVQQCNLPNGAVLAPGVIHMGVAINLDNWPINGDLIGFCDNGSGPQFGNDNVYAMVGSNNGKLAIYAPPVNPGGLNPGTLKGTGTTPLTSGQYYYVEMELTIGVAGRVKVYLDGNLEVDSGVYNTLRTLSGDVYGFFLCCPGAGSNATFSDLYVADTLLGPQRVSTLMPSGDGALSQWTPLSGTTHFNLVNEQPPDGDTSYVSSSTPGNIDLYTFPGLAYTPANVFGAQVSFYARKDDVAARQIAAEVRSGGANFVGSTLPVLTTSYIDSYLQCFNTDPFTGLAWTPTGINAAQFGVNLIA